MSSRPSMRGWWVCSSCSHTMNPRLVANRCSICGHTKCAYCRTYGVGGGGRTPRPLSEASLSPSARDEQDSQSTDEFGFPELTAEPFIASGSQQDAIPHDLAQNVTLEGILPSTLRPVSSDIESDDDHSSVFSIPSVGSSVTSVSSLGVADEQLVRRLALAFLNTEQLALVNVAAIDEPSIGPARHQRRLRRLITEFAKQLQIEIDDRNVQGAVRLLRSKRVSELAARSIVEEAKNLSDRVRQSHEAQFETTQLNLELGGEWYEQHHHEYDEAEDDDFMNEDDYNTDDSDRVDNNLDSIRTQMLSSLAYTRMSLHLVSMVLTPYQRRLLKVLQRGPVLMRGREIRIGLQVLVEEMSRCPPGLIKVGLSSFIDVWDRLKGCVEATTCQRWNWWPLTDRRFGLNPGYSRLTWPSPYGSHRCIDLPSQAALAVQQVIGTAPAFVSTPYNARPTSSAQAATTPGVVVALAKMPGPQGSWSQLCQALELASEAARQLAQSFHGAFTAPSSQIQGDDCSFVYLCTKRGRKFLFSEIIARKGQFDDKDFFLTLKKEYQLKRGWFRLLFSLWQYDYCEFFEFRKSATAHSCGSLVRRGYPSPEDEYDMQPCPVKDDPPIADADFHDFYHCLYENEEYIHLPSSNERRDEICRVLTGQTLALDRIPKRKECLRWKDGSWDKFWGLYAVEIPSFFRVLMYALLCLVPWIIFFFLWLFQWEHASDLQNASVPLTISVTFLVGFVALFMDAHRERLAHLQKR